MSFLSDGLGAPDPSMSSFSHRPPPPPKDTASSAVSPYFAPPADFAHLFRGPPVPPPSIPIQEDDAKRPFCYLCEYPPRNRDNVFSREAVKLWEDNIQETTFEDAALAVSLDYDNRQRRFVPGNPEFPPQAVTLHFTTHGTHRLTRLVMQLHLTTSVQMQMLETVVERDASGRTLPLSDKKAGALAKVVAAQMTALNALHKDR